jgi:hypothetical protein
MADNTTVFNAADDYERFMGRWSRAIGQKFLDWLAPPASAPMIDGLAAIGEKPPHSTPVEESSIVGMRARSSPRASRTTPPSRSP